MRKSKLILPLLIHAVFMAQNLVHAETTAIFDGKTLYGWKHKAGTADYKVENGKIVCKKVYFKTSVFKLPT